jgi:hypothetical protein
VWNVLVSAAFDAGFTYDNDVYQIPPRVSAKSLLHKSGSMTGDIYINFRKQTRAHQMKLQIGDPEKAVITEAKEIISMRNGRATTDQIMRGVVSVLIKNNLLSKVENEIEDILKTNFVEVAKNIWALNERETYDPYLYIPLSKRLEYIIEGVLSDGESHSLDDILVRIFTMLKNGKTPESREIMEILKARANNKGDKWIHKSVKEPGLFEPLEVEPLKTIELTRDEKNEHGWFIAQLASLAYKVNLLPWVGKNEQNLDEMLQKLSIDRLEIAGLDEEVIRKNRIDQIDLIWLKDNRTPIALFEIENSTQGMNCIPRMGNLTIALPHLRIPTYIIAPDKYENVIVRQLTSISSQYIQREDKTAWKYILYSDLLYGIDLFEKKKITGEELLKRTARIPKSSLN